LIHQLSIHQAVLQLERSLLIEDTVSVATATDSTASISAAIAFALHKAGATSNKLQSALETIVYLTHTRDIPSVWLQALLWGSDSCDVVGSVRTVIGELP
jgi:hypothetical protein